ncbi:unnamed protein product [Orchesella dallaii]|uniref:Ankyrin repeat protein n=1 Tax=Orchesella dallaii TaxID=48710 RepID=A0ABP1RAE0_9HEXA
MISLGDEEHDVFNNINSFNTYRHELSISLNNSKYFTKPIISYKFERAYLCSFIDFFASKPENKVAVTTFLAKNISSENVCKWIHACINENLINLLKIIFELDFDASKIYKSEDLLVLAVNQSDMLLVKLVAQNYKNLSDIKIPLLNSKFQLKYFISILHVAALKSSYTVFEYLLSNHFNQTINHPEDLLYCFVADTHEHDEVEGRKRSITLLHSVPFIKNELHKPPPLLAPKIHVDLIILVINLKLKIDDTDDNGKNILHRCPKYLTPNEYDLVVNALVQTNHTRILYARDNQNNTPLHVAIQHLDFA